MLIEAPFDWKSKSNFQFEVVLTCGASLISNLPFSIRSVSSLRTLSISWNLYRDCFVSGMWYVECGKWNIYDNYESYVHSAD